MTVIRRSVGLLTAISLGLLFPTIVYGVEVSASDVISSEVSPDSNRRIAASVDIEERLEPVDGRIDFEQTFFGNADELIVIYTEGEGGLPVYSMGYGGRLFMIGPDGEQMFFEYNYPTGIDLTDAGDYLTVRLPETGEYRVVFEDGPIPVDEDYVASSRVLQIRPITYYERLMIAAEDLAAEKRYEESLALLALAVEDTPDLPSAYILRSVMVYAEKIYNTPAFNEKLEALENNETGLDEVGTLELVYETFAAIDSAEQALIVSDLRQISKLYAEAAEEGVEVDFFTPELVGEIADFLETGENPDALRILLFGVEEDVAEPASEF